MIDSKDWKLFRCIYDEMGQFAIEGEYCGLPNRFEEALAKDYGEVGWIIGKSIKHDGGVTVRVVLEGSKEVLEHILELVKKNDDVDHKAWLQFRSTTAANGFFGEEHIKNNIRKWWNRLWRRGG